MHTVYDFYQNPTQLKSLVSHQQAVHTSCLLLCATGATFLPIDIISAGKWPMCFLRIIVSRFFVNIDEQFHFDHPEKRQDTSFCRAYPTGTTILVPPRIFRRLVRDAIKHAVVKLVVHPAVTIASTN